MAIYAGIALLVIAILGMVGLILYGIYGPKPTDAGNGSTNLNVPKNMSSANLNTL